VFRGFYRYVCEVRRRITCHPSTVATDPCHPPLHIFFLPPPFSDLIASPPTLQPPPPTQHPAISVSTARNIAIMCYSFRQSPMHDAEGSNTDRPAHVPAAEDVSRASDPNQSFSPDSSSQSSRLSSARPGATLECMPVEIWTQIIERVLVNSAADVISMHRPLEQSEIHGASAFWKPATIRADVGGLLRPLLGASATAFRCWNAQQKVMVKRSRPELGSGLDGHVKAAEASYHSCASEVVRQEQAAGNTASAEEQRQLDGWRQRYVISRCRV
jgi:hypothetical protein